jgi:hypothetical protein
MPEENYRHLQWGQAGDLPSGFPSLEPSHIYPNYPPSERSQEEPSVNVDYSQVAAVETGFKKLKSNQIEILKELRREYEVLRNTQLDPGVLPSQRMATESVVSNDDSASKSRSEASS